ncbi:TIGR02680 family protein [Saccharopolyspora erythraea]|uniref:TIGR02680 family protein n=1 Tax=Saccharopolyspora erythraea TaxID=1836 RepID=UPI001BA4EB17|nr:TIGR02680 family protein [Saccharopolyspora erythraea]QUH00164.1 TIGR02680 family protein [Saccharopolyspora erythraea]
MNASRWIPSRAGILNVWRYYDEVFEFHEGRLLLRGQNGSGKSKALELLLPFLFDASLRAHRLSTFGTSERTMHWNLMGDGASGTTRVGYVWLEFRLPGGPDRWFTCGARLQASKNTTTAHADYFTTGQRIGTDVTLVNDSGQPLTKAVLEERLGDSGVLHGNAGDYRAAVRSTLFPTLNEQRYDALITALLQLRTPKLSQRLDPQLLSSLLSRALPPLGQQEIADLAEGFERLDRQRERLANLDEEVAATKTLASRQKSYAQRVLRAAAGNLITSTTELDKLTRTARESAEEYEGVAEAKTAAEWRAETLELDIESTESRITGLTESERYKKGEEYDRLRRQTTDAELQATAVGEDAAEKRSQADKDRQAAHDAARETDRRAETARAQQTETSHAATRAGMTSLHDEIAASLDTDVQPRRLLRAAVRSRHEQLDGVRAAIGTHDRAVERRTQAEDELDQARTVLSQARERREAAAAQHEAALARLSARVRDWASCCRELHFPDPDALLELIESETGLLTHVDSVAAAVLEAITRDETSTSARLDAVRADRKQLSTEVDRLAGEQDLPPDPPLSRTADRSTMTGAPLWRLVDFADTTSETVHGPIEAALQASGLLDAWIGHNGAVAGHDVFADPAVLAAVPMSLADVLVPEQDAEVPADVVRKLLSTVAFGDELPPEHPAAIGADGSWRLGNVTGTWSKEHPAHIGVLARQRARQRRIGELRERIDEHGRLIAELEAALAALRSRRDVLDGERKARPDHRELHASATDLNRAGSDVDAADSQVRRWIGVVTEREKDVKQALLALTALAAQHNVPADRAAVAKLSDAVGNFQDQAENWLDSYAELLSARREASALGEQARRSGSIAEQRESEAGEADKQHRRLVAKLEAIEGTVGADFRQVQSEIEDLRRRLGDLRGELASTHKELNRLAGRLGELGARRTTDAEHRDAAVEKRDTMAHRFRHLATGVFPADSGMDDLERFKATLTSSDGVRATLDAARMVAAAWPTLVHAPNNLGDAVHRLSESVHECRSTLSSRADLDLETDEDVQVFTAVVDGVRVGAAELLAILRGEAERSRHEITERERELFDKTLTGGTRRHLADRIRQATELVDGMNARLERVRTASNVAVQLVWQVAPDLPAGTKAARDLLLKDPVRLTESDRESLHQFFRDRIEQAKADGTAASWEQQLAQVFDYTSWHRFVVKVDRANGAGWQLLTKKLHGALSGGEKAIALHLPLFAAVAAHYEAAPEAPRLILLDEVFVGVDSINRGQVFALLSALDLDLMLTSDHEWCTYAELSGIAIHQLITGDDSDAVTTARFTWNGHDLAPDGDEP